MSSPTDRSQTDRLEPLPAEPIDRRPAVVGAPRGRDDSTAVGTAVVAEILRAGPAPGEQMPYVGDPAHGSMAELIQARRDDPRPPEADSLRRRRIVGASVTIALLAVLFALIAWLLS